MPKEYTEEELKAAGLTEEELNALNDEDESDDDGKNESLDTDEGDEEEKASQEKDAEEQSEQDEDTESDDEPKDDGEPKQETTEKESKTESKESRVERITNQPVLVANNPENAEEVLAEIEGKRKKLVEDFDAGELTAKEFQAASTSLDRQEREIERAIERAQIAAELNQQNAINQWMDEVNRFIHDESLTQGRYLKSSLAYGALDTAVKMVASGEGGHSLTGRQILERAHEMVGKELGWTSQVVEKKAQEPKKETKKINHGKLPPNLGKLPSAEINSTEGKYSALDMLAETDPERFEQEVAKLTPAQRKEFEAMAN